MNRSPAAASSAPFDLSQPGIATAGAARGDLLPWQAPRVSRMLMEQTAFSAGSGGDGESGSAT